MIQHTLLHVPKQGGEGGETILSMLRHRRLAARLAVVFYSWWVDALVLCHHIPILIIESFESNSF